MYYVCFHKWWSICSTVHICIYLDSKKSHLKRVFLNWIKALKIQLKLFKNFKCNCTVTVYSIFLLYRPGFILAWFTKYQGTGLYSYHSWIEVKVMFLSNLSFNIADCRFSFERNWLHEIQIFSFKTNHSNVTIMFLIMQKEQLVYLVDFASFDLKMSFIVVPIWSSVSIL